MKVDMTPQKVISNKGDLRNWNKRNNSFLNPSGKNNPYQSERTLDNQLRASPYKNPGLRTTMKQPSSRV